MVTGVVGRHGGAQSQVSYYNLETIEPYEEGFLKKPINTYEQRNLMTHAKITLLDPEVIDWKSGDISLTEIWLIARKSGASQ